MNQAGLWAKSILKKQVYLMSRGIKIKSRNKYWVMWAVKEAVVIWDSPIIMKEVAQQLSAWRSHKDNRQMTFLNALAHNLQTLKWFTAWYQAGEIPSTMNLRRWNIRARFNPVRSRLQRLIKKRRWEMRKTLKFRSPEKA